MTQDPIQVEGDTPEEVHRYLDMIRRDLKRTPMLEADKVRWARFREAKAGKLISWERVKRKLGL